MGRTDRFAVGHVRTGFRLQFCLGIRRFTANVATELQQNSEINPL